MKRTLAALLIVAFVEPALLACPVCFQADDSATSRGIQAAVIVLCAVTTGVLSVCGVFVARFAHRERQGINLPERTMVREQSTYHAVRTDSEVGS